MKNLLTLPLFLIILLAAAGNGQTGLSRETPEERNVRMAWWRDARFGMFIHWGVYSVPAQGEWYMYTQKVPIAEYEKFPPRFNPVQFNPREWVRLAKRAGMKYIVITSKHHDGFCMFDSHVSTYDIVDRTPFKRDPLKELAEACKEEGIRLCFYHSIMDWHHPDAKGDRFPLYRDQYLKPQLNELLTHYGPIGVLWFDGEWIPEWTEQQGKDLYAYVRSLQPAIIVNNRVGKGRNGMEGMSDPDAAGDFGTPEQEIPANGIEEVDWESCMTMNDNWGFAARDSNWKSTTMLIRNLVDIASKGGNYLLNVGPTSLGTIPAPSVDRLEPIGRWMDINGESIHGTVASPLAATPWGRCTRKNLAKGYTRLYLHVFDWPKNGNLVVTGMGSIPWKARLLADSRSPVEVRMTGDSLKLTLPLNTPDSLDAVISLDFSGAPVTFHPPALSCDLPVFLDNTSLAMTAGEAPMEIRYTLDASAPSPASLKYDRPVIVSKSATIRAQTFLHGKPVSTVSEMTVTKVSAEPAVQSAGKLPRLTYRYYEGNWDSLPNFNRLLPADSGNVGDMGLSMRKRDDFFGVRFTGFIDVPVTGMYAFALSSDDGSRLLLHGKIVINNDGLHGLTGKRGWIGLEKGLHPIEVLYFNKTGEKELVLTMSQGRGLLSPVPASRLFH